MLSKTNLILKFNYIILLLIIYNMELYSQWIVSYKAGSKDLYSNFMGGTEMRLLTTHKGMIFGGVETWMDETSGTGDPDIGAQILRLENPTSAWKLDKHFNELRNNPKPGQRTLFRNEGVTALESIIFNTDSIGKYLIQPDTILIAACRDFNGVASVYVRDDRNGRWDEVVIAEPVGNEKATIRSFTLYRDKVTGIDMVFAGSLPQGIISGVYAPELPGKIKWNNRPEISACASIQTGCFQGRPMAFTECNSILHVAAAPIILRRIDGKNPKWEEVFRYSLTVTPGGSSGLRGLTAVKNPNGNGQSLLAALEGNQGQMVRLDPISKLPYSAAQELDIMSNLEQAWQTIPPSIKASYVVVSNSKMIWIKNPLTNDSTLFITIQHHPAKARDDAFYYIRNSNKIKTSYDLMRINNTLLNPSIILNSTRACVISPFNSDNGKYVYLGGYDADDNPSHNTAYVIRGDINTAFGINTIPTVTKYSINPKLTDQSIDTYTSDPTENHIVYNNNGVKKRNQLFVFFPGTNGSPLGNDRIDSLAANMGYHSIGLMYPNSPTVSSLCTNSSDINCFETVRREIIDGIDRSNLISVNRSNSIENRIIKLLKYLNIQKPTEGWNQFYDLRDSLIWEKIVVSGHSQGGGHAGIIAKYHKVAGVLFFASPKDYSSYYNKPAEWLIPNNATPVNRYFGFSHFQDAAKQQIEIYSALGIGFLKDVVDADSSSMPYNHAKMLTSSLSVSNPHNAVVVDNAVPLSSSGVPVYLPVWEYMLSEIPAINTISTKELKLPNSIHLEQNYPNPFNPSTVISFQLPVFSHATLKVFDILGREVAVLLNEKKPAGLYQVIFDGSTLASGVYFYRLSSESFFQAKKMILTK